MLSELTKRASYLESGTAIVGVVGCEPVNDEPQMPCRGSMVAQSLQ